MILLAWHVHPEFPLVVAANRDEFLDRPTLPAHRWHDHPTIFAGRDSRAGGTWMGITADCRFAALTNYRDPALHREDAASRGHIVRDALLSKDISSFLESLRDARDRYNPFNLLVGDAQTLFCLESRGGSIQTLPPGIHGLSNADLNTSWPKVETGKRRLAAVLPALPACERLFELLSDTEQAPDDALPATGVPIEWERMLSAACIRAPGYGTRSQTVVLWPKGGAAVLSERVLA
nr:NRDE family protein [Niveibacterium umoris]